MQPVGPAELDVLGDAAADEKVVNQAMEQAFAMSAETDSA